MTKRLRYTTDVTTKLSSQPSRDMYHFLLCRQKLCLIFSSLLCKGITTHSKRWLVRFESFSSHIKLWWRWPGNGKIFLPWTMSRSTPTNTYPKLSALWSNVFWNCSFHSLERCTAMIFSINAFQTHAMVSKLVAMLARRSARLSLASSLISKPLTLSSTPPIHLQRLPPQLFLLIAKDHKQWIPPTVGIVDLEKGKTSVTN